MRNEMFIRIIYIGGFMEFVLCYIVVSAIFISMGTYLIYKGVWNDKEY